MKKLMTLVLIACFATVAFASVAQATSYTFVGSVNCYQDGSGIPDEQVSLKWKVVYFAGGPEVTYMATTYTDANGNFSHTWNSQFPVYKSVSAKAQARLVVHYADNFGPGINDFHHWKFWCF